MNPTRDLHRLDGRLTRAREVLRWPDERLYLRIDAVSAWSPAEHVDHLVRACDLMLRSIQMLERGEDERILGAGSPSLAGRVVMTLGWIPRGRGRAPEPTLPQPVPVRQHLRDTLTSVHERASDIAANAGRLTDVGGRVPHPVLGAFSAAHWARFADVHSRHHLAIIADIDRRRAIGVLGTSALLGEEGEYGAGAEAQ